MRAIDLSTLTWRKSSYSNSDGGACVEVSDSLPSVVPVRDSKDTTRTPLLFTAPAWAAFVDEIKVG
ncbi:DUF397 domain-containing protein [Streptomyces misionensis]|uniref:DUF397 domain-containing protein n=1 Tax=Streptomyces misionensis TaxID=67331 RepID=A0A5C6JVM1_9ACTN|nr:DUF397 domain-containing protein [Streptomyces misionensis]TWV52817.1 DUF397 domain-containing protein [Streptomyces misionensis]